MRDILQVFFCGNGPWARITSHAVPKVGLVCSYLLPNIDVKLAVFLNVFPLRIMFQSFCSIVEVPTQLVASINPIAPPCRRDAFMVS